jgi:hypothetical protein
VSPAALAARPCGSHGWMARRRGNGLLIVAATPEDLEELLEADYAAGSAHAAATP